MSDNNKSYRIRTNINTNETIHLNLNLNQDYKNFEILSLNLDSESLYKMYTSEYGCIVGRVLANDALGIPNAKVSVFVKTEESDDIDPILHSLYPYENFLDKNEDNIRYNTLPDEVVSECHQSVGTFPNKRLVLDDENILEIYNKYYKYSTTTNASGDYMIFGVPVGEHVVHVDIDLSDIGELSIRPIDMMQMGYDASQFESPSMFKKSTDLDNLSQIFSQNTSIMVKPFWGNDEDGQVSITRNDISIQYKFEPSCVFIGSLITFLIKIFFNTSSLTSAINVPSLAIDIFPVSSDTITTIASDSLLIPIAALCLVPSSFAISLSLANGNIHAAAAILFKAAAVPANGTVEQSFTYYVGPRKMSELRNLGKDTIDKLKQCLNASSSII